MNQWHADLDERMNQCPSPARGHRVLPHTADVIIEAWGPSRLECLEEAVLALVDSFACVAVAATKPVPIELDEQADEALLVSLLDEVIYVIDVLGGVPANLALAQTEDGRVVGVIDLAPFSAVEIHGSPPKGVSLNELSITDEDKGRWSCRATIDV
jgi:SHS2 domain-containing protein